MKAQLTRTAELLSLYSRNPSIELRNQLVQLNSGLVRKIARQISQQSAEPYEDLQQVGFMGLIRAIERFNLRKGYAFSSFAVPYIRGEILNFLRDRGSAIRIPRRWQELYRKSKKLRQELAIALGHQPNEGEMAKALGVSLQEWRECRIAARNRSLLSLDVTVDRETEGSMRLEETLADARDRTRQHWQEERWQLQGAIAQLEGTTQAAIECIFLQNLSRKEAARQMGVSPITITRHVQKGVNQLVSLLQPPVAV